MRLGTKGSSDSPFKGFDSSAKLCALCTGEGVFSRRCICLQGVDGPLVFKDSIDPSLGTSLVLFAMD